MIFEVFLPHAFECGEHHRFHGKADMPWCFLTCSIVAQKKTKAAMPAALKSLRLPIHRKNHTRDSLSDADGSKKERDFGVADAEPGSQCDAGKRAKEKAAEVERKISHDVGRCDDGDDAKKDG